MFGYSKSEQKGTKVHLQAKNIIFLFVLGLFAGALQAYIKSLLKDLEGLFSSIFFWLKLS